MPYHENWDCKLGEELDDDGDPPRVWNQDLEYPGTAFTRSIGDSLAETLGVIATPEIREHEITADDHVLIIASDGVFEFITNTDCVRIALLYSDPLDSCKALVGEALCGTQIFNPTYVRVIERFGPVSSAVLRELDESNRSVQRSAESTSI